MGEELKIDRPCMVRLRCGGEVSINAIEPQFAFSLLHGERGRGGICWMPNGRFYSWGEDHPFDVVEVAGPIRGEFITGPGRYPIRGGGFATVESNVCTLPFPWSGRTDRGLYESWMKNGACSWPNVWHPHDIIGPMAEEEAEKT